MRSLNSYHELVFLMNFLDELRRKVPGTKRTRVYWLYNAGGVFRMLAEYLGKFLTDFSAVAKLFADSGFQEEVVMKLRRV